MMNRITMAGLAGLALAGCVGAAVAQDAPANSPSVAGEEPIVPPVDNPPTPPGRPPAPPPVTLVERPGATGGEALYVVKCAMCHGPDGMGTGLLGRNPEVAQLEARDNLTAPFVVLAARNGIGNMPAIPRGEVSDEEMQAIAEYLAAGPYEVAQ